MQTLSDNDFARLHNYIKKFYGIDLSKKKQLIVSRLTNDLIAKGYISFSAYVDEILSGRNPDMVTAMLNKLTTNYTFFLREEEHFKYLWEFILPELAEKHAQDKSLRIWSAGCSSGEEPYTISMYLKEYFGSQAHLWDTRVLASDISQKILEFAINPSYHKEDISKLPAIYRQKYFNRTSTGNYTISPSIKENVVFTTFNLMNPIRYRKKFDLIFCRNVMIYFDSPTKEALVQRFYDATVPGGYLFIGRAESLNKATCPYRYIMPSIYRKE